MVRSRCWDQEGGEGKASEWNDGEKYVEARREVWVRKEGEDLRFQGQRWLVRGRSGRAGE